MKLVGYCRQCESEINKPNLSIGSQLSDIVDYAKNNNVELVNLYVDKSDGSDLLRPEFNMAIEDCLNSGADGILVCSVDRITTKFGDFEYLLSRFFKTKKLIAIDYPVNIHSADGRLNSRFQINIAEFQRER